VVLVLLSAGMRSFTRFLGAGVTDSGNCSTRGGEREKDSLKDRNSYIRRDSQIRGVASGNPVGRIQKGRGCLSLFSGRCQGPEDV